MDYQHGPRTSSIFVGPGPKPWAVLAGRPEAFTAGGGDFYSYRFAILCSRVPGRGSGVDVRAGPTHS